MAPWTWPERLNGIGSRPLFRRLAVAGWILVLTVVTCPWPIEPIIPNLDSFWIIAINQSFHNHVVWGSQINWTYGPYGFVDFPFLVYGWNTALSVVIGNLINAFYICALAIYLIELRARPWAWIVVAMALLLPMRVFLTADTELLLAAILVLYVSACGRWPKAYLLAIPGAAALAFLLLIKGTGATAGVAIALCYLSIVVLKRRWLPAVLFVCSYAVLLCALWMTTAPLEYLPGYLQSVYTTVAGYSSAVQVFRESPIALTYAYIELAIAVFVLLMAAVSVIASIIERDYRVFALSLLSVPLIFATYKEVYVRFGDRGPFLYTVVVLAHLPVLLQMRSLKIGWLCRLAPGSSMALCAILLLGAASGQFQTYGRNTLNPNSLNRVSAYAQAVSLLDDPSIRARKEAKEESKFRSLYHFSPAFLRAMKHGTVDAYPIDSELGYAFGLDWDPRPSVQSYGAYTTYLDEADAAHYLSPRGPEHIVFSYFTIDNRYAMFDEPATLRAIQSCYHVEMSDSPFLLLTRNETPCVEPQLTSVSYGVTRLGSTIPVPVAGEPVYASIKVADSAFGSLASLAFQPSELRVQLQYPDGHWSVPFRWIPGTGPDGLQVSSYVSNITDFASVMSGQHVNPIRAFRIYALQPDEYQQDVRIQFSTVS